MSLYESSKFQKKLNLAKIRIHQNETNFLLQRTEELVE